MPIETATLKSTDDGRESLSLHWRGVFAGLFISLLVYAILMSLGLGLGATGLQKVLQEGGSIGPGAGIWAVVSVIISLFVGSYAAGRVSGVVATRIGYTQGSVISALFFSVMLSQISIGLGIAGLGLKGLASSALTSVTDLAKSTEVQEMVEDSLGNFDTKSDTKVVISGVISRLARDDRDAAITYLTHQADISREEATALLTNLDEKFHRTVSLMTDRALAAASWVGWSAFVVFVLGLIASMVGGGVGALVNLRRPLGELDRRALAAPLFAQTQTVRM